MGVPAPVQSADGIHSMKTEALPAPTFEPLDPVEYKRQATLLKALHCAHPVMVDGKEFHLQVFHARQSGGRIEGEVWLAGNPESVEISRITIPTRS
jgi:hypothetical protein